MGIEKLALKPNKWYVTFSLIFTVLSIPDSANGFVGSREKVLSLILLATLV